MRAATIGAAVVLAAGLWSTAAAADDTPDVVKKNGVYIFKEFKFVLRPPRPTAVVDMMRSTPRAPLPELRQPLLDRIGQAVDKDPF
jgi:hypothetical protein